MYNHLCRVLCLFGLWTWTAATAIAQGPLVPTAAPAPTMRTLLQIEPRTPLETLPVTISTPGTYYLTKSWAVNSDGTVPAAILVTSDDVTIDLGGFTISNVATTGIAVTGTPVNLTIKNGVIRDIGGDGIGVGTAINAIITNVAVKNMGGEGIETGAGARISNCTVSLGAAGIKTGGRSSIKDCAVESVGGIGIFTNSSAIEPDNTSLSAGSLLENCLVSNAVVAYQLIQATGHDLVAKDSETGFNLSRCVLERSFVTVGGGKGVEAVDSRLVDVYVSGHAGGGIYLTGGSMSGCFSIGNKVGYSLGNVQARDCVAKDSTEQGFLSTNNVTLTGCAAYGNAGNGFQGSNFQLTDCDAVSNGNHGIEVTDSVLTNCRSSKNAKYGLILERSRATGLTVRNNTEAGVQCNARVHFTDSLVQENGNSGIIASSNGCVINGNYIANNGIFANGVGYAGILVSGTRNRITDNTLVMDITNNEFGIQVTAGGTRNVITGNFASGHTGGGAGDADYNILGPNNFYGTILENATGPSGSSEVFANFRMH